MTQFNKQKSTFKQKQISEKLQKEIHNPVSKVILETFCSYRVFNLIARSNGELAKQVKIRGVWGRGHAMQQGEGNSSQIYCNLHLHLLCWAVIYVKNTLQARSTFEFMSYASMISIRQWPLFVLYKNSIYLLHQHHRTVIDVKRNGKARSIFKFIYVLCNQCCSEGNLTFRFLWSS